MVYTVLINVWITSIDAHIVHNVNDSRNEKNNTLVTVLTNRITELDKLQEARM
jgi:hypothetical protein